MESKFLFSLDVRKVLVGAKTVGDFRKELRKADLHTNMVD